MQKHSPGNSVVLFASRPDLKELCAVSVRVEPANGMTTTQPRILKCRELIFTEPAIIASPSADYYDCFNVIMPQTLFKTGRVQARMKHSNLEVTKPTRVNPGLYQACLRYTMLARLAPAWNKAGDWLIQGRDFLSHSGCANAVQCELVARADELYISLSASVVRLAPLQLADLNLSDLEVQKLLCNAEHQTGELALHNSWCRVMPSMKKGRLCSISLSIPQDSPFTSYREIKRHWKNTYGFRLPETDDDIFFGQIRFGGFGGRQFTYPSVCLRADGLQRVPRVESKPILSAFLQDLHAKLPTAGGHPLKFQPNVRHAVATLYAASEEVKGPGPNLGKGKGSGGKQVALRDPRQLIQMSQVRQQSSTQPSQLAALKAAASTLSQPQPSPSSHAQTMPSQSQLALSRPQALSSQSGCLTQRQSLGPSSSSQESNARNLNQVSSFKPTNGENPWTPCPKGEIRTGNEREPKAPATVPSSQPKFVPVFKPSIKKMCPNNPGVTPCTNPSQQPGKIIPSFKPRATKQPQFSQTPLASSKQPKNASVKTIEDSSSRKSDAFLVSCPIVTSSTESVSLSGRDTQPLNPKLPEFKAVKSNVNKSIPAFSHGVKPLPAQKLKQKMLAASSKTLGSGYSKKVGDVRSPMPKFPTTPSSQHSSDAEFESCSQRMWDTTSRAAMPTPKRKAEAQVSGEAVEKKARSKPQVQDVDVEMLARRDQLGKVNTLTLITWLRDRGIHCKSKDKKGDLVTKVKVCLALTSAEP